MNDEIVEEIHQIRKKTYEETKNMSSKELIEYYHQSSEWVQQQIAECRAKKGVETRTAAAAAVR